MAATSGLVYFSLEFVGEKENIIIIIKGRSQDTLEDIIKATLPVDKVIDSVRISKDSSSTERSTIVDKILRLTLLLARCPAKHLFIYWDLGVGPGTTPC